jgi:hypothetical protein
MWQFPDTRAPGWLKSRWESAQCLIPLSGCFIILSNWKGACLLMMQWVGWICRVGQGCWLRQLHWLHFLGRMVLSSHELGVPHRLSLLLPSYYNVRSVETDQQDAIIAVTALMQFATSLYTVDYTPRRPHGIAGS